MVILDGRLTYQGMSSGEEVAERRTKPGFPGRHRAQAPCLAQVPTPTRWSDTRPARAG